MQNNLQSFQAINDTYYPDTKKWSFEKREQFMQENEGLIIALIAKYPHISDRSMDRDDLYQIACMAFWDAFSSYDPTKGTRFTTYAQILMKNEIFEVLRWSAAAKRMPEEPPIAYDTIITRDGEEKIGGDNLKILDLRQCSYNSPIEEQILQKETTDIIYKLLATYSEKSRYIFLSLVFKTKTQQQLAKELECSQSKISMDYKIVRSTLCYDLMRLGYFNDAV